MILEVANQEKRYKEVRLGPGLRRMWLVSAVCWLIYLVQMYYRNCHFAETTPNIFIFCSWPTGPYSVDKVGMVGYTHQDILGWLTGVPIFGAVVLWGAFWILRGFRPVRGAG
jgi:hypothetical protein